MSLMIRKNLIDMKKEMESEIDGGEECLGRDQQLSRWIECIENAYDHIEFLELDQ